MEQHGTAGPGLVGGGSATGATGAAEAADRLARLEGELRETRAQLTEAARQLGRVRNGRLARARTAVYHARRRPRLLPKLPAQLARIALTTPPPVTPEAVEAAPGPVRSVVVPEIPMPDGPVARPGLVVATLLDPFSAACFRYEWEQVAPGPDDWREVLGRRRPDLFFAESTWNGNDGRWKGAMTNTRSPWPELREMLEWCRAEGIPTVFWNKEDPPNYDRFIASARLFDHVLTVDEECVEAYRRDLGHDRVGVLPFAAQPRIHHPIRPPGAHRHEVAFAGTYFAERHSERRAQVGTVLDPARAFDLHVFSRTDGKDPRYRFPDRFTEHIVGSLPYEQMLVAYKLYKVFLNITSVTDSATTCSRRVFELAACGTPVVSAAARGIEAMFGDLVPSTTSAEETTALLGGLLGSGELRDRLAHRALRAVLAEHTYGHRADAVLARVGLTVPVTRAADQPVSVLATTEHPERLDGLLGQVARQTHRPLQLVLVVPAALVADAGALAAAAGLDDVAVLPAAAGAAPDACLDLALDAATGAYVATFDDDAFYGSEFLRDLLDSFGYTDAEVAGKRAHYVHDEATGATVLRHPDAEHRYADTLEPGTVVAATEVARRVRFAGGDFPGRARAAGERLYAADRFSFARTGAAAVGREAGEVGREAGEVELLARAGHVAFYGPAEPHVTV